MKFEDRYLAHELAPAEDLNQPLTLQRGGNPQVSRTVVYTITVRRADGSSSSQHDVPQSVAFDRAKALAGGEAAEWFSKGEREGRIMGYTGDGVSVYLAAEVSS